jgi:hypothetical protein
MEIGPQAQAIPRGRVALSMKRAIPMAPETPAKPAAASFSRLACTDLDPPSADEFAGVAKMADASRTIC